MAAKILLVDDSPTILSLLRMALESRGYEVLPAQNGVEALKIFGTESVDLLITDINMPRMDGYMLISSLRARRNGKHLPVIILSTQNSDVDHDRSDKLSVDMFLHKPLPPEELLRHVSSLLNEN